MGKKVLVAMSGGVDSSVAAALLKDQGYDVVGAFFITWTQKVEGLKMCPWEQDVYDARRVCNQLGIPLYTFNFEKEYKERVIEYFFREYQAGRTPNPDVMCNREIKFDVFLKKAKELGFEYIATGHYAQVKHKRGRYELHKGKDGNKDQSYFLYALREEQLSHSIFPLGKLTKPKVRELAKKYKLPNASKKDSQGICFLGHVKLHDFLQTRIPIKKGKIVDEKGNEVGVHDGTMFYTIGQRHGLNIGGAGTPYYVVAKNNDTNTLVVSKGNVNPDFTTSELQLSEIHWINNQPKLPKRMKAKIRYRQPDQKVKVSTAEKGITLEFKTPQRAAAEGQSAVLYKGTKVLGGGVIDKIYS